MRPGFRILFLLDFVGFLLFFSLFSVRYSRRVPDFIPRLLFCLPFLSARPLTTHRATPERQRLDDGRDLRTHQQVVLLGHHFAAYRWVLGPLSGPPLLHANSALTWERLA